MYLYGMGRIGGAYAKERMNTTQFNIYPIIIYSFFYIKINRTQKEFEQQTTIVHIFKPARNFARCLCEMEFNFIYYYYNIIIIIIIISSPLQI